MSITDLRALKVEITLIVKENLDTLMGVGAFRPFTPDNAAVGRTFR